MLTNHEIGEVLELEVGPAFLPGFHRDDIACFTHIRPVLLAMGCVLDEVCNCTVVYVYDRFGKEIIANENTYATALCHALTYVYEHRRDELARAVEEVKK